MKNYSKILFFMFLCLFIIGTQNVAYASVTTWNPNDKTNSVVLSNDNFTAQLNNGIICSAKSTNYMTSGKYYCELKINNVSAGSLMFGVANDNFNVNTDNYDSKNQFAYYSYSGSLYPSNSSYGSTYGTNDVIGMAIDIDNKKIKFSKNGTWYNETILPSWSKYYAYITSGSSIENYTATLNFGNTPFIYNPPTGYSGYDNTSSIVLNKSVCNLKVGENDQLIATTTPAGSNVIWSTSDETIVQVEPDGTIRGMALGTATITAKINGTDIIATCEVTVTAEDVPTDPEEPSGDGTLFIELEDGNIKQYAVTEDKIADFIQWYKNRDNDDSESPIYKFTKGDYKDYVVHDKIVWFEIR